MTQRTSYLAILCLFMTASLTAQDKKKAAAKTFGLSIIQSFFDHNCDYFFDHLAPEITSFESGQQFKKSEKMRKLICAESPLRPDMEVSYAMYEKNYAPKLYSAAELAKKHPQWEAHLNLQKGDIFFDGAYPSRGWNRHASRGIYA